MDARQGGHFVLSLMYEGERADLGVLRQEFQAINPKLDRDDISDLCDLFLIIISCEEGTEDYEAAFDAFLEILQQKPIRIQRMEQVND